MPAATCIGFATLGASLLGLIWPRFLHAMLLRPYRIEQGAGYQTLVTRGFVHADIGHLLFNLFIIYTFGEQLELTMGAPGFVLLYFLGLLVSGLGTCLRHRNDPTYAAVGASGAVLALTFAGAICFPSQDIQIGHSLPVALPAPLFAVGYLLYTLYKARRATPADELPATATGGNPFPPDPAMLESEEYSKVPLDHDAHFFGAFVGLAFALLLHPEKLPEVLRHLHLGGDADPP